MHVKEVTTVWINWVNMQASWSPRLLLWQRNYNSIHFLTDSFFILAFVPASKGVSNWQLWLVNDTPPPHIHCRHQLQHSIELECRRQESPVTCGGVCHPGLWVLLGESPEWRKQVRIKQGDAIETENGPLSATLHTRQAVLLCSPSPPHTHSQTTAARMESQVQELFCAFAVFIHGCQSESAWRRPLDEFHSPLATAWKPSK